MYHEIKLQIEQAKNILLIAHKNPDGDTLGSVGAFLYYLKKIDKKAQGFCVDPIPTKFHFLALSDHFAIGQESFSLSNYDLLISFDCGDIKQTGIDTLLQNRQSKLLNIDHHQTNDHYGDINIVETRASSTAEIIYDLFIKNNFSFNQKITDCLMTGILTDTSFFANAATTDKAVFAASKLMSLGANLKTITQNVWRDKNLQILKLWGRIFDRLIFNQKQQSVTAIITRQDLAEFGLEADAIDGIANFLTNLQEAKIVLVLMQPTDNVIKGSLRTNDDNIDVSQIAKKMHGGGHQKAAGFTTDGTLKFNKHKWWIEK